MDGATSLAGRLLVAMPGIGDPRFEHAVILVCSHDDEHAMGVRLDAPAPGVDVAEVLKRLDLPPSETPKARPVLVGGPVDRERGFVIHSDDWLSADSSLPFGEGLAMTATRDALVAMGDAVAGPRRAVLALGYAGWDEGQLESELAENVWLVAEAEQDIIFDLDHASKWSRALRQVGVSEAGTLSGQSGRA
ncbi:MAG TPA: YqgE/AlgH family protein [Brevundimonas sp.]|jgi:putative transcriptional regulator|uniref:YqgE/AlgH family protein n=1 Tax=Brevundimonas sp. TaxID=1871086 RepID=UPI002DE81FA4|nr:YqgE/AlgH family protein [Brevundimonas sp.]